jgi:hypothetical protein
VVDESPVSLTVYDLMGRIVFSNNYGMQLEGEYDEQLDLSSLNSGLYIVNVELNGSVETTKIQIVK